MANNNASQAFDKAKLLESLQNNLEQAEDDMQVAAAKWEDDFEEYRAEKIKGLREEVARWLEIDRTDCKDYGAPKPPASKVVAIQKAIAQIELVSGDTIMLKVNSDILNLAL